MPSGVRVEIPQGLPSAPDGNWHTSKAQTFRNPRSSRGARTILRRHERARCPRLPVTEEIRPVRFRCAAPEWGSSSFRRALVLQTRGAGSEAQDLHHSEALSSNGRTPGSQPDNAGSTPASATIQLRDTKRYQALITLWEWLQIPPPLPYGTSKAQTAPTKLSSGARYPGPVPFLWIERAGWATHVTMRRWLCMAAPALCVRSSTVRAHGCGP